MRTNTTTENTPDERRLVRLVAILKQRIYILVLFVIGLVCLAIRIYLEVGLSSAAQSSAFIIACKLVTDTICGAALSTVLIGFGYEWLVRRETGRVLELSLQRIVASREESIIDDMLVGIPKALMVDESVQNQLLKSNKPLLELGIRSWIGLHLDNRIMGAGLYDSVLGKSLSFAERYSDYQNQIIISSIQKPHYSEKVRRLYFDVTLNIRYTTTLQATEFRFARAFTNDQQARLMRDEHYRYVLLFPEDKNFPENKAVLAVTSFKIDDEEFEPVETEREGVHEWVIANPEIKEKVGTEVILQYSIVTKVHRYGHCFTSYIANPTNKCGFQFQYARSDIAHVNIAAQFETVDIPRVYSTPQPPQSPQMAGVDVDGWVFPQSGVTFVWNLQEDQKTIRHWQSTQE